MNQHDIDQIKIIADYTRRRNQEEGLTHARTHADASRRANLRILAAKCGEVLARTLYGIDIRAHTRDE